jgi:hypothetical protein
MAGHLEALWRQMFEGGGSGFELASFEFVDAPAIAAVEMMMVRLSSHLVSRRLSRQFHRHEPPFVNQASDRAVDRGNPKARQFRARQFMDLNRIQRAASLFENVPNCRPLACTSILHDRTSSVARMPGTRKTGFHGAVLP